jgi:methionine synthase I (cobalamin-dependent)
MTRLTLNERIGQGVFFLDGAMGTQLFAAGAQPGSCNELLNLESPAIVAAVHRAYLEAGSDAVITNTFGGNTLTLRRHGLENKTVAINRAGAKIARQAAGPERWVLGDIGPCGDFLEPLGSVKEVQLAAAFAAQAEGLAEGGVDGFIIETMTALEEILVAIAAVRSITDELPIFASLAYDPAGREARTMMGISPQDAVNRLADAGITAIGFNCGTLDMPGYVKLARTYAQAVEQTGLLLLAEPNAGRPELEGDKAVYKLTPDDFAETMAEIAEIGVRLLGGCCGTTPEHIAAAVRKIKP